MEERRYTEEEMAALLRRASREHPPLAPPRGEFTLGEVEAIAREAGLDPLAVRSAAALVPAAPGRLARVFLGGAARPSARGRLPGRIDPSRYAGLRDACERAFGRPGEVEEREDSWTWREEHGPGRTTVEVRQHPEAVEVRVEADRQGWALLAALVSLAAAVVALFPLGGIASIAASLGLLAAALAPFAGAALLLRVGFPLLVRGLRERVEEVTLAALALVEPGEAPRPALPPPPGEGRERLPER